MHCAVFAAIASTPAIMIAYDPKVSSFARQCYHPVPLDPDAETFDMRTVVSAAGNLCANLAPARQTLRARTIELCKLCAADIELAKQIYFADY